jgi:hypothetical protein
MIQHTATGHHPTLLLDSSSKRMCTDSDLGLATLQVRDQVLHRSNVPQPRLPQLGSPPGPVPARCWPDFRKTFDQSRTAQQSRDYASWQHWRTVPRLTPPCRFNPSRACTVVHVTASQSGRCHSSADQRPGTAQNSRLAPHFLLHSSGSFKMSLTYK